MAHLSMQLFDIISGILFEICHIGHVVGLLLRPTGCLSEIARIFTYDLSDVGSY